MDISALKTGMLFNGEVTKAVCDTLKSHYTSKGISIPPLIVDPVCVSTSGHTLLESDALGTVVRELFPLAAVITPNKQEAEVILNSQGKGERAISDLDDMVRAAWDLSRLGPKAVLVKGGHIVVTKQDLYNFRVGYAEIEVYGSGSHRAHSEVLEYNKLLIAGNQDGSGAVVVDVLYEREPGRWTAFVRQRIETTSTHGTGCTLSAALAAELAKGGKGID
jgi:hydroxymethylpyrimidine/phosphomethylpyrimidine kinase / thiaminase